MFSTDGQLVWSSINFDTTDALLGNAYNQVPIFHVHEIMSFTYLLLCKIIDNSLSQTARLWVLVSAIQLFHK